MNTKLLFLYCLILAGVAIACKPEHVLPELPTYTLVEEAGLIAAGDSILAETEFSFKIAAEQNDGNPFVQLLLSANLDPVPAGFFKLNGSPLTSLAYDIPEEDQEGFIYTISATAPADRIGSSLIIGISLVDEDSIVYPLGLAVEVIDRPPTLTWVQGTGLINDGDTIVTAADFQFQLKGAKGNRPLKELTVLRTGQTQDQIKVNGTPVSGHVIPFSGADQDQFDWTISMPADQDPDETVQYTLELRDELDNLVSLQFELTTGAEAIETQGIRLWSAAGPVGAGGVDLDKSESSGLSEARTDIQDEGIDLTLPLEQNWKQQLSALNGTELRLPKAGIGYDDLDLDAEIRNAFLEGTPLAGPTAKLKPGDTFLARRESKYFLFTISGITITPLDNSDSYLLDIKQ